MSRKILGLDVRTNEITAVLLVNSINGNEIIAVEHILNKDARKTDIGDQAPSDSHEIEHQQDLEESSSLHKDFLDRALSYISQKMDIDGAICMASLPADEMSFRNISVPFKSAKDILRVLPYELEPTLPFPITNIAVDFNKIEHVEKDGLFAVITSKDYLASFLDALSRYELNPYVVSVGGYSTLATLLHQEGHRMKNGIFLDIDREKCSLALFSSGEICFYRNFPVVISSPDISSVIMSQVQLTVAAFHELFSKPFVPEVIYVTGSGSKDLRIENGLDPHLHIPVKRSDLASALKIEPILENDWEKEAMDNALALTLIDILDLEPLNFCERPLVGTKIFTEYKSRFIRTGSLLLAILAIGLIGFFSNLYMTRQQLHQVDKKIDAIFDVEREINGLSVDWSAPSFVDTIVWRPWQAGELKDGPQTKGSTRSPGISIHQGSSGPI